MCRIMLKQQSWRTDASVSRRGVNLCLAAALDGLHQLDAAIATLEAAVEAGDSALNLALAKLLFRGNRPEAACQRCLEIVAAFASGGATAEEAAGAYQLAGWTKIHSADHSAAYALWREGYSAVPADEFLLTQHLKRRCWDEEDGDAPTTAGLVGAGHHGGGACTEDELEAYPVVSRTSALALFEPSAQRDRLVFRSRRALLLPAECAAVLRHVDDYIETERGGSWGTVRASSVVTTDVAVEDIAPLRPWLRELLQSRLYPMLQAAFPQLADGSTLVDPETGRSRMRVHDAFIVRYDAERDGSCAAPSDHMPADHPAHPAPRAAPDAPALSGCHCPSTVTPRACPSPWR